MRTWIVGNAVAGALLSAVVGVGVWASSSVAQACGGTFCDVGPTAMPVDQSGENILFVLDEGTVEAHVQIQYQGDPDAFAWVVPVMARPEIEAGSDALFQNLLGATVPTFLANPVFENCGDGGSAVACGSSDEAAAALSGGDVGFGGESGGSEMDPTVVASGVAGAFEYSVLEGGTVEGVVQWLDENGYAQDDDAPTELQGYLDKGFLFVAFKLRGGTGVDEIHPVVIRYAGDEPCVPIRLTRIAATDDMGVRVFFLGESRVAPSNYRSVEINLAAIDWQSLGGNYLDVVTQAVDTDEQGHAFVTEYAGDSSIVPQDGLLGPSWDSGRFVGAMPAEAVDELQLQGLLSCQAGGCVAQHPLLGGLLERFLPRPVGVSFEEYYDCIECYDNADFSAWNPGVFAEELEARIITPGEHAVDVLRWNDHLTRLFTTLSPHEMTLDPVFHENPDLPDVSASYMVDQVFTCEGPDYVEFADGTRLALAGADPRQPAAARITEVPTAGAPMVTLDLSEEIEAARVAWNDEQGLGAGTEGCNCRARTRGASGVAWAGFMLGLGMWARRRRRG